MNSAGKKVGTVICNRENISHTVIKYFYYTITSKNSQEQVVTSRRVVSQNYRQEWRGHYSQVGAQV